MFSASQHLSFDYSSTASHVLRMLSSEFDYPCLKTEPFEDLIETFANDLAEHCFKPLAALLAPHNLELWQIDFAEDTVRLAVVPTARVESFKAYWSDEFLHDPEHAAHFKPTLRRIVPVKMREIGSNKAKQTLALDVIRLPAAPELDIDCSIALMRSPGSDHPDNDSWFDFAVWPPAKLSMPAQIEDPDFARRWRPVYQRGQHNIWSCRELPQRGGSADKASFKLAQVGDMNTWPVSWLGGEATLPGRPGKVAWAGGLLVCVSCETDSRGKHWYCVTAASEHDTHIWHCSRQPLHVYPVPGAARCIIIDGDAHLAMAAGPVSQGDFLRLPKPLYNPGAGVVALGGDTVVFFTGTKARLRMHRMDLATMEHKTCLLKHFGHSGVDRGTHYSSFGSLEVRPGHGDWWILNHKSDQFGKIDIALMWNAATDESFVIEQGDIKLEQPTILYQRALGRYLAVRGESVALLRDFQAAYDRKEKQALQWESA